MEKSNNDKNISVCMNVIIQQDSHEMDSHIALSFYIVKEMSNIF